MEQETCLQKALRRRQERTQQIVPCYLEATKSQRELYKAYEDKKKYERGLLATIEHPSDYLLRNVYPHLVPALEQTAYHAIKRNALKDQKQVFNGIDYLAEVLWNKNPKYPKRQQNWKAAFFVFRNKSCISERPKYPLSWILPKDLAVTIIQAFFRGYMVRKMAEVQEMRQFWKAVKEEGWVLRIPSPEEEFIVPERIPLSERLF